MLLPLPLLLLSLPLLLDALAIPQQIPILAPAILRIIDSDDPALPQTSHAAQTAYDASVGEDSIFADLFVEDKVVERRKVKRTTGRKLKKTHADIAGLAGDLTYSTLGTTACGTPSTSTSLTLPATLFDASPSPCGRLVRVLLGDHTFDGVVSDRGEGFGERDVGVSAEAFGELVGSLEVGRVAGVEWIYLE